MIKKKIILGVSLILATATSTGVFLARWSLENINAIIPLNNQPLTVSLPNALFVKAKILDNLDISLNADIETNVPIDQTLSLPIKDTLHVEVGFDHEVPIKMDVPVQTHIDIDQMVSVDSHVTVRVLGKNLRLPVKGNIPIKTQVLLDITVPVDQDVHLQFKAPASVVLDQPLNVDLKTDIDTIIPIQSTMSIPVHSALNAEVTVIDDIKAVIEEADLDIPLNVVNVGIKYNNKANESTESP